MTPITAPLRFGDQGPGVADLHVALRALLERAAILPADPAARQQLLNLLQEDRRRGLYGDVTGKIVATFQGEHALEATAVVDEPTAGALNALLRELGLLDEAAGSRTYLVVGAVRREGGLPLAGVVARAFHEAEGASIRLGEDTTDVDGRYTIRYEPLPGGEAVDLRLSAVGDDGLVLHSSEVRVGARPLEIVDLTIPPRAGTPPRRLAGRVLLADGRPVENLTLRVYRPGFGGTNTLVSEATTTEGGNYAFALDGHSADAGLHVVAVRPTGEEIPLAARLNYLDGAASVTRDLMAPVELAPTPEPEFRRLAADLQPHVGEIAGLAAARETSDRPDLTVLSRATHWDARLVGIAALAARLSADEETPTSPEAFYGLLRAGLPSDRVQLARVSPAAAASALRAMRDAGIIGLADAEIDAFQEEFLRFATTVRLSLAVPGGNTSYGAMLASTALSAEARDRFADLFFNHSGEDAELWRKAREGGLSEKEVGELQLQGRVSFLTSGSGEMTAWLLRSEPGEGGTTARLTDTAQLADRGLYSAEGWEAELDAAAAAAGQSADALIPTAYTGAPEQRRSRYTQDMARRVRSSYPMEVLAHRIGSAADDAFGLGSASAPAARLLRNAAGQGFRLGQTPTEAFFATHPGAADGLTDDEYAVARAAVRDLQRTYQISTSDEVMAGMRRAGLKTAHDVTAMSAEDFFASHGHLFPSRREAELVYRKAEQVSSMVYNLFTMANRVESEVEVYAASAPAAVRQSVRNELTKHYPTLETLFGSMDFCECEHCRSVLSPAAYLVDLLQYVEGEPAARDAFEQKWATQHAGEAYTSQFARPYDALIERRPDLIHIPLTCENTHTALPYIDLVNEILEYYVAHGALAPDAARDTGGASTEELLAEPQYVIGAAYDAVLQARYPLTLPFDLWLETVREFAGRFETPLAELLEAFRPGEELYESALPYDRAAVFVESLGLSPAELALYTDPDVLANARWQELYGYPATGPAIADVTNADPAATLTLPNDDIPFQIGSPVTYLTPGGAHGETLTIEALGEAESGGAGRTLVTLDGVWATPPAEGDRLVPAALAQLGSARTLADRLGVSYRELVELVRTDFINPMLGQLGLLRRIGVSVGDVFFYESQKAFHEENRDLLGVERADLSAADQARYDALTAVDTATGLTGWERLDRVQAVLDRLAAASEEFAPFDAAQWMDDALAAKELDDVLVLADPDPGGGFDAVTLRYADGRAADEMIFVRLNLFVRLWRKLRWTMEETDRALTVFTPRDTPFDADHLTARPLRAVLIYLAHLKALVAALPLGKDTRLRLLTLWSDLATTGAKPLYAQLFLTRSVLKNDPVFDDPLGQYLRDEAVLLKDHVPALQGALGLTAAEVNRILANAGLDLDTASLTLANVSLLYRYGLLARGLRLSVSDLIALKEMSGLDPFAPLHAAAPETLAEDHPFSQTLRFVEVAAEVRSSGLKIEDLDYLLRHRFDPTGEYRADPAETLALLRTLADGIRAIRAEHGVPADPAALTDDLLRQKLGLVLPAEIAERLLAMLNGTGEVTAVATGVADAAALDPAVFVAASETIAVSLHDPTRQEQKLTYRGVLLPARQTALEEQFAGVLSPEQRATLTALLDGAREGARSFFETHLQKSEPGVLPSRGFLDAADFELLFDPTLDLGIDPALSDEQVAEIRVRRRRERLAAAFFPFLQTTLIRQLVLGTLTGRTGADPALVKALLTDARLLGTSPEEAERRPLLDPLAATAERGVTLTFFAAADGTGDPLQPSTTRSVADTGPLPAGANSARIEGHLEVPATGSYRFLVRLDRAGAEATLRFGHLPGPTLSGVAAEDGDELGDGPTEFVDLKTGRFYPFTVDLRKLDGGGARLLAQGEMLPRGGLERLPVSPSGVLTQAERALMLLDKTLQLFEALELGEREVRYAVGAGIIEPSRLPAAEEDDDPARARTLFAQFLGLAAYARLKRDLAPGTSDLIDLFEAQEVGGAAAAYPVLARLARREEEAVRATAEALSPTPSFNRAESVLRLWKALQIVERFAVPVASIVGWTGIVGASTTPERRFAIARDVKESIRARSDPERWPSVARPIFDRLRRLQRDALAAHVMHTHRFERLEQLYEFFLVDPGMEPVVQTSRIRLASASVQLFIQRSLLNLEPRVHPSAILNAAHWEWMKRYRVWEANRLIFLFPENWLEPEFRDDRTQLFTELEGTLLQGDVSEELVEDAFLVYLRKLDELARLELVALHLEQRDGPGENTLHLFGRTFSQPHSYFYRSYSGGSWTSWQPVTAEVEGDHLAPIAWRGRMYLFWVTFAEKPRPVETRVAITTGEARSVTSEPLVEVEARLNWSEYLNGEWTTREAGGTDEASAIKVTNLRMADVNRIFVHVSKEYVDGEERGVFVHLVAAGVPDVMARQYCPDPMDSCGEPDLDDPEVDPDWEPDPADPSEPPVGLQARAFYLAGRNSSPVGVPIDLSDPRPPANDRSTPHNPYSAQARRANRYSGASPLTVAFKERITTEPGRPTEATDATLPIFGDAAGAYSLLPCDNRLALEVPPSAYEGATNPDQVKAALQNSLAEMESLLKPVFYQDDRHTFFIQPDVAERTVEQWESWVQPPPPVHDFDLSDIHEWQVQHVRANHPDSGRPAPGRASGNDWLVNRATLVRFDDQLIGPRGQVPLTLEQASPAMTRVGIPVRVNSAGAVSAAEIVVLGDGLTLGQVGLVQPAGGLQVVGGAGATLAMMNNFVRRGPDGSGPRVIR